VRNLEEHPISMEEIIAECDAIAAEGSRAFGDMRPLLMRAAATILRSNIKLAEDLRNLENAQGVLAALRVLAAKTKEATSL
jgi:hypothetical protein